MGKNPKFIVDGVYSPSLDLNYRKGKFNWFGNYGINGGTSHVNVNLNRFANSDQSVITNEQNFQLDFERQSQLIKTGFDFYINDKNTVSFYTNQNFLKEKANKDNRVNFFDIKNKDIQRNIIDNEDHYEQTYNMNYKIEFEKEGHELELEANYSKNHLNEDENNTTILDGNTSNHYIDEINNKADKYLNQLGLYQSN